MSVGHGFPAGPAGSGLFLHSRHPIRVVTFGLVPRHPRRHPRACPEGLLTVAVLALSPMPAPSFPTPVDSRDKPENDGVDGFRPRRKTLSGSAGLSVQRTLPKEREAGCGSAQWFPMVDTVARSPAPGWRLTSTSRQRFGRMARIDPMQLPATGGAPPFRRTLGREARLVCPAAVTELSHQRRTCLDAGRTPVPSGKLLGAM